MKKKTMKKLDPKTDGSSKDIVRENIAKLKQLFPEIFCEDKVDCDKLKEVLGDYVEEREERYNFTWHGKSQARRIAQTPSTGTLRPCKEESKNWDTTQNLFIEGDNLEVLKLLQKTYHKKVKMIYIDPPYNTGKEFIYPDNYRDNLETYLAYTGQKDSEGYKFSSNTEQSGRYHTKWLNMMYPRLKLARNLLRDDGVIFISIDDNEVTNLRKICDEIFGEDNFVACVIWQKRTSPDMRTAFSEGHEYVLIYSKNKPDTLNSFHKLPLDEQQIKRYANPDNDSRGPWVSSDFTAQGFRPNQMYSIITPGGKVYEPPEGRCWKNIEEVFKRQVAEGRFWFGKDGNGVPRRKNYLSETDGRVPWTWWPNKEVGHTQEAKKEVNKIFGKAEVYLTPKPVRLIQRMLDISTESTSIIFDFFAGSCVTAEAVLRSNISVKDSGQKKFIMVQLPEPCEEKTAAFKAGYKTIAEIGKERIRRAGDKILEENKDKKGIENLDIGFKVFKLDSSNIKAWDGDFNNLEHALLDAVNNIKEDRSEEDVLYELLLKYGLDLTLPIEERTIDGKTVYSIGFGALVICLDSNITLEVAEGIGQMKEELEPEIMRVVFKDTGFKSDEDKTNAIQILKRYEIDDVKSL